MVHGTTVHGTQIRNPEPRLAPGGYYHAEGPMGSMLLDQAPGATIGVVGLGAGSLAGLLLPGQRLVYHEIDPLVERMARAHFTYLEATRGDVSIILGDGRLTLEDVPDGTYDLLVIDAFSSDFVPTHLLTVEALELYRTKVRPGGLVVLHISNVYADLQRVVKGYSVATGQPVAHVLHRPSPEARGEGGIASRAAAISPDPTVVRDLLERPDWGTVPDDVEAVIWTDARVDLPAVLW
jgi:spermidine synthase